MQFGKREANLIKGIAIIAMFYHHFFGFPTWLAPESEFIHTYINGKCLQMELASFGKICVGLYAFVSGYVLFVQKDIYSNITMIIKRVFRFLDNYWRIFFVFIIFGIALSEPMPPVTRFIQQCFGISTATGFNWEFFDAIHPVFAWYVSFYLMFLFIAPVLAKVCKYGFALDVLLISVILFGGSYLINVLLPIGEYTTIKTLITAFSTWGHIGMLGFLFAKHNIFCIIHERTSKRINRNILLLLLLLVLVLMFFLWSAAGMVYIYKSDLVKISYLSIYTPVFIYAITYILNSINCEWINSVLTKLSKESTNMWFLHGLFFTPNKTIQWIAYIPQYSLLILIWTLFVMYCCSIVLNYIFGLVRTFVKGMCVDGR